MIAFCMIHKFLTFFSCVKLMLAVSVCEQCLYRQQCLYRDIPQTGNDTVHWNGEFVVNYFVAVETIST